MVKQMSRLGRRRGLGAGPVAAAVVAVALVVTACSSSGSGGSKASGGSTGSSSAGAKPSGSPVLLYTFADDNTTLQNYPEGFGGAQAAARAINNSGGLAGHPITVKNCNEQAQANTAASCARQAVSDHAAAVVGYQDVFGDNIDPILEAAKIPSVGGTPEQPSDLTSPITYSYNASIGDQCAAVAMQFAKMGYTKIGYLELDNPLAVALGNDVDQVVKKLKTPSGQTIQSYVVSAPLTASDYSPYVAKLHNDGVQGVILLTAASAGGAVMTAAKQAGYDMTFGSTEVDFTKQAVLGSLGSVANGFVSSSPLPDPNTTNADFPGLTKFKADMAAANSAGIAHTSTKDVDAYSLDAWLAVYAVQEASQSIQGDITNTSLAAALDKATGLTLQGLTPPWTPSKAGPASEPRISNPTVYVSTYKDGQYTLIQKTPLDVGAVLSS